MNDRYHRQMLLPEVGAAGQERLAGARVLLVGCGALGCTIADQLARSGVGHLRIVDRDIVERTNLQRQTLFSEQDAERQIPKSVAAAERLGWVNSQITIEPLVADVYAGNIEALCDVGGRSVDLILDGTDNVETRYLINDMAVKRGFAWVYGACVGTEGRAMVIAPGGPCLRCIFPTPPGAGELPTCDTAGVLGPAAALVASVQSAMAIRWLVERKSPGVLLSAELWSARIRSFDIAEARVADCVCCGQGRYEFLDALAGGATTSLCGRDAIQVRAAPGTRVDFAALAERLSRVGEVELTSYLLRCRLREEGAQLTVFADGRAIVAGTTDPARARSLLARYLGV